MSSSALEDLHSANSGLRMLFLRMLSGTTFLAQGLAGLRADMKCVVNSLRQNEPRDRTLDLEIAEYSTQLEQFRQLLPEMRVRLLVEKARLEARRAHLTAAAAWAETRKKTL